MSRWVRNAEHYWSKVVAPAPAAAPEAGEGEQAAALRRDMVVIAELPAGAQVAVFRGRVVVVGPGMPASVVVGGKLVPLL